MDDDKVDVYFYHDDGTAQPISTVAGVDFAKAPDGDFTISWNAAGIATIGGAKPSGRTISTLPYGTLLRCKTGPFLDSEAMVIGGGKIIIGDSLLAPVIVDEWNPDNWEEVDEG